MTISYNLLTCLPDNYRDIETYLGLQNIYIIPLGMNEEEYRSQINRLYQDEAVDACLVAISADKADRFRTLDLVQKSNKDVPIVIIVDTQEEVLQAYAKGVDFATVKPVDPEIFSCYLIALLKRIRTPRLHTAGTYRIGKTLFSPRDRKLITAKQTTKLSPKENEVLRMLCIKKNSVVERDFVLQEQWGSTSYYNGRCLDVIISHLRKLLADEPIEILRTRNKGLSLQDATDCLD